VVGGLAGMGSAFSTSAAPAAGEPDPDEGIEKLARMLAGGRSMTVFTGAGCSVEPPSSIPDFRSPGGLWSRYDPAVYCEYNTFVGQPHLFWEMATELTRDIHAINGGTQEELLETGTVRHARPNAAHVAIADLERLGCVTACITQNIDGLHGKAGSSSVIELHGRQSSATCMACGAGCETEAEVIPQWVAWQQAQGAGGSFVPTCPQPGCEGVLKPDVTLFGEALPTGAYARAVGKVLAAPICLVVGTSLNVFPRAQSLAS